MIYFNERIAHWVTPIRCLDLLVLYCFQFIVPRIGFTLNGNETNGPIELMEGEKQELCVSMLGLQKSEVYITTTVTLSPDSPTGKDKAA